MRALCMLVALGSSLSALAETKVYSLDDLQALLDRKAYAELVEHLGDVRPTQRDPRWEHLAAAGAIGYLTSLPKDTEPYAGVVAARALADRYPSLSQSPEFQRERALLAVDGFALCDDWKGLDGKCIDELTESVKGQPDLALKAGLAVSLRRSSKWSALPLYALAVEKAGDAACKDDRLRDAVVSGLGLDPASPRLPDAVKLAGSLCFDDLKGPLAEQLTNASAPYLHNACPLLVNRAALTRLQTAKCQGDK